MNKRGVMSVNSKSTRDHLIDVGLKLLHQRGYQATGVADVLEAADVSKGSFYHHFDSKEDFAAAALEKMHASGGPAAGRSSARRPPAASRP